MERADLIEQLNVDLAAELAAVVTYITYAARVDGPQRPQLSQFFTAEVSGEQVHATYLANKIVSLGGEPTTVPSPVPLPEGNRAMLEAVLNMERQAVERYTQRLSDAEEFGDIALKVTLEDFIRDETSHVEETEAILRHWDL
ncbi:MAG: ferritin-like domain-containing protein [Chloroflexi bacterium]|nr:ferritin-like domain-containing protein [Chloroflexota bacterium]